VYDGCRHYLVWSRAGFLAFCSMMLKSSWSFCSTAFMRYVIIDLLLNFLFIVMYAVWIWLRWFLFIITFGVCHRRPSQHISCCYRFCHSCWLNCCYASVAHLVGTGGVMFLTCTSVYACVHAYVCVCPRRSFFWLVCLACRWLLVVIILRPLQTWV